MGYIEIRNLKLNSRFPCINFSIHSKERWGIYARNQKDVKELLDIISGINKNGKTVFYNGKNVFDNKEYFDNRLYINFSDTLVTSLNVNEISDQFMVRHKLVFNKEKFRKAVKELKIRSECIIKNKYEFTNKGKALVAFSILVSLDKKDIIINSPTLYIDDKKIREDIINEITDISKYNSIVLGLNNLKNFRGKLDYILFLTDNGTAIMVAPQFAKFVVLLGNVNGIEGVYKLPGNSGIIAIDAFSKEEYKDFKARNISCKFITAYEIGQYL